MVNRFIKTTAEIAGEEPDIHVSIATSWWLDTMRPIEESPGFICVQTYAGKDPNDFVKCDGMQILFTDQAEYYFVCKECYSFYRSMQWSGSTRSSQGWMERAEKNLHKHQETKGWCQFCDPIFGNGGWNV